MKLKGKVALITGSAKGVGSEIAKALAKEGATVVVNYLKSEKEAEETLNEVKKFNDNSIKIKADVTDKESVKSMFNEIIDKFGRIDILINNVGDFIFKSLNETSHEEFEHVIRNNLFSAFLCCKEALPYMRKQKFGRIINFGCASCDRLVVRENTTPYYIAKTGVLMLSKALAVEEAKYNININVVSPGALQTSVVSPEMPKGRLASMQDIVNAVLFLLSEKSDYVSGANIEVSGAWVPGFR